MSKGQAQRLGALLALVLCACAGKQPKPDEPPVKSLKIEGTKAVSTGDIEEHILTTGPSWWPFAATPYFDPIAWQADLRRIERYYQAQGFYQAQVVNDDVKHEGDGVALTVEVNEGNPTKISAIDIEGLDELPPDFQQRVRRSVPLKVGEVLHEARWEGVKKEVAGALRQLGYAEAEVRGEVFVETTNQTARVRLICVPGPRYKFGNVFVATGPKPSVAVRYIIDQAQGAIRKGDWYSDKALEEAQRRVFQMGVFGAVKVTTGRPDRENAVVPVVVDVREAPFHTIRYGGGIGLDPVRQEYRFIAEYTDRNFLGDLRKLTLRAKVGWAFLPALWNIDQQAPIFDLYAEFEQPRFPARDFKWLSSVDFYKNIEQAYGFIGVRAKTGIVWQPHSSFRIYPSYNIEVDRITGITNGLSGNAPQLAYGCNLTPEDPVCYLFLSYLEVVIEWDKRDDKLEPRNGWFVSLGIQQAVGFSVATTSTRGCSPTSGPTSRGAPSPSRASSASEPCSPARPAPSPRASSRAVAPSTAASAAASSRLSSRCPTTTPPPPIHWWGPSARLSSTGPTCRSVATASGTARSSSATRSSARSPWRSSSTPDSSAWARSTSATSGR